MKINKDLLPMKLHYFFMFAGTAPLLPFLPVYANTNLHMSYAAIGLVYTILPFLGLFAKMISGTLADWLHAHQKIFLSSVVICGAGFFSIYFAPAMPTKPNPAPGHVQFDCSSPESFLRYPMSRDKCGTSDEIEKLKDNQTTTCYAIWEAGREEFTQLLRNWNISIIPDSKVIAFTAFSPLSLLLEDEVDIFFPIQNITYQNNEIMYPTCSHVIRTNLTIKCDNDDLMKFLGAPNEIQYYSYGEIIDKYAFWTFFFFISIAWCGLAVLVVMSDTKCFQLLGDEVSKYGIQRMHGSIGWGVFVIFTGIIIDVTSDDYSHKNYVPAFILAACLFTIDFIVAIRLKVQGGTKGQANIRDVAKLLCQPRIVIFILCCIAVGMSTGVLWTYQLMLVEKVAFNWDCHFRYMKLLQGLIIGVSSFGGELPFFFISGFFIDKLGHVNAMSVVIAVFSLRFILYFFVRNPWLFLPIELLNGFTFGIFYAVMTSYASLVAPQGTQATMQGLVGAAYEGLGVAIGGFTGGALFEVFGGSYTFLFVGIFNAIVALCHIILQIIINRVYPESLSGSPGHGYLPPSESFQPVPIDEEEENEIERHWEYENREQHQQVASD